MEVVAAARMLNSSEEERRGDIVSLAGRVNDGARRLGGVFIYGRCRGGEKMG
jgi:hypothetical protein